MTTAAYFGHLLIENASILFFRWRMQRFNIVLLFFLESECCFTSTVLKHFRRLESQKVVDIFKKSPWLSEKNALFCILNAIRPLSNSWLLSYYTRVMRFSRRSTHFDMNPFRADHLEWKQKRNYRQNITTIKFESENAQTKIGRLKVLKKMIWRRFQFQNYAQKSGKQTLWMKIEREEKRRRKKTI